MSHFIEYYDCGEHVYTQCRCMSPNKIKRITNNRCPWEKHTPNPKDSYNELREGIQAVLDERPETAYDPFGQPYLVAVPWRDRLYALLNPSDPREAPDLGAREAPQQPQESSGPWDRWARASEPHPPETQQTEQNWEGVHTCHAGCSCQTDNERPEAAKDESPFTHPDPLDERDYY